MSDDDDPISSFCEAVRAAVEANSLNWQQCRVYLLEGPDLNVKAFLEWFNAHKDDDGGQWLKEKDAFGSTLLHLAFDVSEYSCTPLAVWRAVFDAWPDACKELNMTYTAPLRGCVVKGTPSDVVRAHLRSFPSDFDCCVSMAQTGSELDLDVFLPWFEERKEETWIAEGCVGESVIEGFNADTVWYRHEAPFAALFDATLLQVALCEEAPEVVILAILNAYPDAVLQEWQHSIPLYYALGFSDELALAVLDAWPDGAKEFDPEGLTALHVALKDIPKRDALVLAMIKACPESCTIEDENDYERPLYIALKHNASEIVLDALRTEMIAFNVCSDYFRLAFTEAMDVDGWMAWWKAHRYDCAQYRDPGTDDDDTLDDTVLHLALACSAPIEVVHSVYNAWPAAIGLKNASGLTPLHHCVFTGAPAEAVAPFLLSFKSDFECCESLLNGGTNLDVDVFFSWWQDHKHGCAREYNDQETSSGPTLLETAVASKVADKVTMAILDEWPGLAKVGFKHVHDHAHPKDGKLPLYTAIDRRVSTNVTLAVLKAYRGAANVVGSTSMYASGGQRRPIHALVSSESRSDPALTARQEFDSNIICFALVAAGASLTVDTAPDRKNSAVEKVNHYSYKNKHLKATINEITMFKSLKHLGKEHFRDWTAVSHAWCTPSAKLTALTVLMVGETYKRGLLPRLSMDVLYKILNMVPRYELRLGTCSYDEENAAELKYNAILRTAKAAILEKERKAAATQRYNLRH